MTSNFNEKKLTVLELGTTDTKGGAAAVSWSLKTGLETRGHKVNMIVGYKRSHAPSVREIWDTPANNFISKLIGRNFRARLHHHLSYWLSNDIAFLPGKRILKYPEYTHADIVHAHNLHSLWFNLKTLSLISPLNQTSHLAIQQFNNFNHKPLVWTLHDMWPMLGQGAHAFECSHWISGGCDCSHPDTLPPLRYNNSRHLWKLKKQIYEQSRLTLVTPSLWLKSKVERSILKDKPLYVIYNGIDTDIFKPCDRQALRAKLNLPQHKKIVLFSAKGGKDNIWKGGVYLDALLEKYRNDNQLFFLNLGGYQDNPTYKPFNNATINHAYSVPFISDQQTLAEYYAASDLLIYPSVADNCPLTILEALSTGLPVLAFPTGGIPELVVHKEHGYIAAYKDLADLTNGLEWLINLPRDQYAAIAAACRKRAVEKFSLDQMVDNYLNLYYQILGV